MAMAHSYNKIPITYNVGNFMHSIKNNINGLKVKNNWSVYFELLSNDKNVLDIQKNISTYKQNYTWKKASDIHLKVYKELISNN